jgi:sulfite exporter TauE/SafE/copper chaperone CopZ
MAKKTYFIQGMHCSSCESFIQRTVSNLKGIKKVNVSLTRSQIEIDAESLQLIPSLYKLNQLFNKDGYSFNEQKQKQTQDLSIKSVFTVGVIFLFIVLIFFTFNGSELFSRFYVDSSSNLPAFFLFGIAAGISSCAAMVGGLLLSVQEGWVDDKDVENKRGFLPFLLFNASRIITFAILGGLLGALGGIIQLSFKASAILTILISLLMFIIGMQMLGVRAFQKIPLNFSGRVVNTVTRENKIKNRMMPIIFGAITFFVPCGFTLIAQAQALESGSFFKGLSVLTAFALGTLPVLLLISFSSLKFYKDPKFSKSFRLLSGLLIVFFAIFTLNSQLGILQLPSIGGVKAQTVEVPLTAPEINSQVTPSESQAAATSNQVMQMEVKGFEYFPKVITIKAGLPTKFEITDNGSIGCARAVYARGLYPDVILLQPGLNTVELGTPVAGTYQISCSMWMVEPITVVVE